MDINQFYDEIKEWINQCNQYAVQYGMHTSEFWTWAMDSTASICEKYNNNELVKRQMIMLHDWLTDIYEKGKEANG